MLTQRLVTSFLTLAETLSYTQAARQLYLSHQALSRQIARLEEELGHPLFARSTRRVALTAAGELFYRYFKDEAGRYAQVCLEAERLARIQARDLRVGFPLGIRPPDFFARVVQRFQRERPECMIRMEWHDVDALTRRFEGEALDVVFSLEDSGLSLREGTGRLRVARCRLVLAAARDDPAWQEEGLSGFSGHTFFYEQEAAPETTNEMRRTVERVLRQAGVEEPRIELVPNLQSRQTAVELGTGCCLSLDLETLCANPLVRSSPLGPASFLSCYWRREGGKPAAEELVRLCREELARERGQIDSGDGAGYNKKE